MKYILILLTIVLTALHTKAQNYADSSITLQLTQRAAWYIGYHIKQSFSWAERNAPTQLRNYVGSGTRPDSLFNVTLKAGYITGMIELLMNTQAQVSTDDRRSIIFNQPAIVGYTPLSTQVTTIAAGITSQKATAQYILDYYNRRVSEYNALRQERINEIVTWSKQ